MQNKTPRFPKSLAFVLSTLAASTLVGCAQGSSGGSDLASQIPDNKVCSANDSDIFVGEDVPAGDRPTHVKRRRKVRVDFKQIKPRMARAGAKIRINLFDDRDVTVEVKKVSTQEGVIVAQGVIAGNPESEVTLATKDNVLLANIHDHSTHESFEVRTESDGSHSVDLLEARDETCAAIAAPLDEQATISQDLESNLVETLATNPVIDMLVAYTPAALAKSGSVQAMETLIRMGIADTNRALADSGVRYTVRLVGTMKVAQNETANFSTDLSALKSKTDGKWDEVHAARARLGADQVTLIGAYNSNSSVAGIGYIRAAAASAFTIVKSTTFGQYTFTHELGHNIGLNHSDGLENAAGRFRTVMAYGSYKRIRRFSSPGYPYNGYITGDANHNSAAILNANFARTAGLVAQVLPTSPGDDSGEGTPIACP